MIIVSLYSKQIFPSFCTILHISSRFPKQAPSSASTHFLYKNLLYKKIQDGNDHKAEESVSYENITIFSVEVFYVWKKKLFFAFSVWFVLYSLSLILFQSLDPSRYIGIGSYMRINLRRIKELKIFIMKSYSSYKSYLIFKKCSYINGKRCKQFLAMYLSNMKHYPFLRVFHCQNLFQVYHIS